MDDGAFLEALADRLLSLPAVEAVTLGGSRAYGTATAASDWDLGIYYRGAFEPDSLRRLGYPGEVSEIGGWGGGVFNGGAWLRIDDRAVDIHYRDLDVVERELEEARAGRVRIERLAFHLAGIPSYLLVAELAMNRVLRGSLPRPEYPEALRRAAAESWWNAASIHLAYAREAHAAAGRTAQCLAMLTLAATQTAHAVLAARGEWATNEKSLLDRAGLRGLDRVVAAVSPDPVGLRAACETTASLCTAAMTAARFGG